MYQLKLQNTLTKQVFYLDNLQENLNSSDLFYCFTISLPNSINDGEYNYTLFDDGKECAEGLLQVGDYEAPTTTYNNKEEIVEYNG